MSELRWAIFIIGALVIMAIYIHGRYFGRRQERDWDEELSVAEDTADAHGGPIEPYLRPELDEQVHVIPPPQAPMQMPPSSAATSPQPVPGPVIVEEDWQPPEQVIKDEPTLDGPVIVEEDNEDAAPLVADTDTKADVAADAAVPATSPLVDAAGHPSSEQPLINETLMIYLMAWTGTQFRISDIKKQVQRLGLVLDPSGIFLRRNGDEVSDSLYQIANVMEPGVFDTDRLPALETPGIVIFTVFPTSRPLRLVVREMYEVANILAEELGGDVLDEHQQALTSERFERLLRQLRVLEATQEAHQAG
jgi:cell division protein ZipA